MDLHDTLSARATLKMNKSVGGGDGLVPDFLKQLPIDVVYMVHCLLLCMFRGQVMAAPDFWRCIVILDLAHFSDHSTFIQCRALFYLPNPWFQPSLVRGYPE